VLRAGRGAAVVVVVVAALLVAGCGEGSACVKSGYEPSSACKRETKENEEFTCKEVGWNCP
jgi:hypothetical protein